MHPDDLLFAFLLAASATMLTITGLRALVVSSGGDAAHLFEPQWKREARELSRHVPTGDRWGR